MAKFSTLLRATGLAVTVAMPVMAQDADTVLATVNGTDITLGHVIVLADRLPPQFKELEDQVLYDGLLDQLIKQTFLGQEMAKLDDKALTLAKENEARAFLAGEFLARYEEVELDEAEIEALYAERFAKDTETEMEFNASHILVETEELAKEIIQQLINGADFAELAKENSTGPTGPGGGLLGWFGTGAMVPEFEEAVLSLEDGAITETPVQTQFGWHVVKRNESRTKSGPALDDVRADLENELRSKAIQDEMNRLDAASEITRADVTVEPSAIRDVGLLSK